MDSRTHRRLSRRLDKIERQLEAAKPTGYGPLPDGTVVYKIDPDAPLPPDGLDCRADDDTCLKLGHISVLSIRAGHGGRWTLLACDDGHRAYIGALDSLPELALDAILAPMPELMSITEALQWACDHPNHIDQHSVETWAALGRDLQGD